MASTRSVDFVAAVRAIQRARAAAARARMAFAAIEARS
jgi:hypothetical protein